jgi:hypothetical protein
MKDDFACSRPECTFAITGTCLESINDPTRNCTNLKVLAQRSPQTSDLAVESVRQFPPGLELGLTDVSRLMRARYAKLIGVLGQVEAGKTCLFTSLYLQLTGRYLCPQYRFITSETLLGFEQRARHLRDWSLGGIRDQIVDHTQLGHSRSPAFLHLAFQDSYGARHDLLLPDLPGEWTTQLLSDASTASRFAFLSRSDVVMLVLEAPQFATSRTRNNAITDATHIFARLADNIRLPKNIPVVLAVTKCDETDCKVPSEVSRVTDVGTSHGYSVQAVALAAFPNRSDTIPMGFGIGELLTHLTSPCAGSEYASLPFIDGTDRSFLKARGNQ